MEYYFSTVLNLPFEEAIQRTVSALKNQGFGVLTEIDIRNTLKQKLDVHFPQYTILGACNPPFAHKALQIENKIGTMLPCNVIVREAEEGNIEVAAVNPIASMMGIHNEELTGIAEEVRDKLKRVIESLEESD